MKTYAQAVSMLAFSALSLFASPAGATVPIAEWNDGDGSFELSGYGRMISGYSDLGYGGELFTEERGMGIEVGHLERKHIFGSSVEVKVENLFT